MKEFWQLLKDLSSVQGWIVKTATGGPIIQFLSGWGPPWPPQQFATASASVVVQVFVVMWALTFWRDWSKSSVRLVFAIAVIGFFLAACAYVVLFGTYTRYIAETGKHIVVGTTLNDGMSDFIHEQYADNSIKALDENGPDFLYARSGLVRNRLLLLLTWVVAYLFMSAGMTAFVGARTDARDDTSPEPQEPGTQRQSGGQ